jgi:hypothetical protein
MWEKYFSNYPGVEPVIECKQTKCQDEDAGRDIWDALRDIERYNTSCSITEPYISSSERLYPVQNDENMGFSINGTEHTLLNAPAIVSELEAIKTQEFNETTKEKEENKDNNRKPIVKSIPIGKQPADIIFECGTGQGYAFVTRDGEALTHTPFNASIAKTLGIAAIDTTCLKYPKTKVLFSCIIDFRSRAVDSAAQLEFVLSRSYNNGVESPIGNWVYDIEIENCAQSFKFNFCNCNSFPGCYNYYVRVLPAYVKNCSVCITNCHIDAIAQSIIK